MATLTQSTALGCNGDHLCSPLQKGCFRAGHQQPGTGSSPPVRPLLGGEPRKPCAELPVGPDPPPRPQALTQYCLQHLLRGRSWLRGGGAMLFKSGFLAVISVSA